MQDGLVNEVGYLITKKSTGFLNIFLSWPCDYCAKTITMPWHTDHNSAISIHAMFKLELQKKQEEIIMKYIRGLFNKSLITEYFTEEL